MNIAKEIQSNEVEEVLSGLIKSIRSSVPDEVAVDAAVLRFMILLELENKRGMITGLDIAQDHLLSQSKQKATKGLEGYRIKLAQDLS